MGNDEERKRSTLEGGCRPQVSLSISQSLANLNTGIDNFFLPSRRQKHISQQKIVNKLVQFLVSIVQDSVRIPAGGNTTAGIKRRYTQYFYSIVLVQKAQGNEGSGHLPPPRNRPKKRLY